MPLTAVRQQQAIDASNANGAMANATTPIRLRMIITVGSVTAAGTEAATGGGYTSGSGAPSITMAVASGSAPASSASTTAVTITNYPRSETINGVEGWDSAGTPIRQWLGSLTTPRTPAAADTVSFAIGAVVNQMS
jgi:hypothetical protein